MHLYIQEHLTFYIHDTYTDGLKKKYINITQQLKIYTSFHEQAVCKRSIKMEGSLLDKVT